MTFSDVSCCIDDDVITGDTVLDIADDVPLFGGTVVSFCDVSCCIDDDVVTGN